ncbi:MAG: GNAT family N-acetyltransferase [Gaiellaceae bacterium]
MSEVEPGELLSWDTDFWGVRIGRVVGGTLPAGVDAWAAANAVDCLYFLAGEEPVAAHDAERAGFRLMDVRVELARPAEAGGEHAAVRPFNPADVETLQQIARTSHRLTRFYADPRFPPERCDDLYDVWIARSCEGWADAVLVADDGGAPVGYVSCHADDAAGRGSIGLIAVDAAARGRGLGAALVRAAVGWCGERGLRDVSVVTQGRSVPALRLYERCGFGVAELGLWFHKWYR